MDKREKEHYYVIVCILGFKEFEKVASSYINVLSACLV